MIRPIAGGLPGRPAVQHYSAWQDRYFFRKPGCDCPRETRACLASPLQFPHSARHSRADSAIEMCMMGRRFCERERSQNRAGRGCHTAALDRVMTITAGAPAPGRPPGRPPTRS